MDHSYERATQLGPSGAVLAPLTIFALLTFQAQDIGDLVRSVITIAAAAGFHVVAMRLVRDRGNKIQASLWSSWGGSTTIQGLRWEGQSDPSVERLHRRIQSMCGLQLPTRSEEQQDPHAADEIYKDAAARLREMTRDHVRYPRVYSELVQYGTARNLYGAKPAGIAVAGATFTASVLVALAGVYGVWEINWWLPTAAGIAALGIAGGWVTVINREYVLTASRRYSDALLSVPNAPGPVP
ncbi:hypothetical protein [Plantibacter sp. MMLR14_011]|uniref:hypothetical protein n=1 Tax=Plantibacter sp. MMLR14_011 TaxID=1898746 RepID=UPI001113407A|nr:hypothetical protein [Plantibacter sp. MMLR14_011]